MLERPPPRAPGDDVAGTPPRDRVGAVFSTDRPMPLYAPGREPVTYSRAGLWIAIGILVALFAVFFGWALFLR